MSVASGQFTGTAVQNATNGSYTFGLSGTGNLGTDALSAGGSITLSNSLASGSITDTFVVGAGTDTATTFYTANHGDNSNSLANLATTIAAAANLNATAAVGSTGITVTSTTAAGSDNITSGANTLTNANNVLGLYSPTDGGSAVTGTATVTVLDSGGAAAQDDALTTGTHITLTQGANVMTFTAAAGQTYADLALAISSSNLGVNATWSSNTDGTAGHGGLVLTSKTNGVDTITVGGTSNLTDTIGGASIVKDGAATAAAPGSAGSPGSFSTAVLQLNNGGTITDATDTLTGSIALSLNGGATQTYIMGTGTNAGNTYYTGANTVASLLTAISITNTNSGMTATVAGVQAGTGAIYLQSNTVGAKPITVVGASTLADVTGKSENTNSNVLGRTGVAGVDSTYTVGLVGGAPANTTDVLATGGSISITNGSVTEAFTVGTGTAAATTYLAAGSTMSQLATAISGFGALGLTAQANTTGISLTSSAPQGTAIVVNSSTIADATLGHYQSDSLGTFASESDIVTGTMSFSVGGVAKAPITLNANSTVKDMIDQINLSSNALGVTANWVTTSNGFGNVVLTSKTEGTAGAITFPTAAIVDTTATATLSYSASNAYDTGMVSDATNVVYDSTTGQGTGALNQPAAATFISNAKSGSGVATTSYSDGAGQSLAGTNLLTQGNSQSALTALNTAITDAAAQDGYIGAQINTLNSVSQVMTTQQENVASAQNAIQATDYASATSNMSKYEILSQTGIAALAQANTVQQEVTKLLQ
jgi:flagellin